MKFDLKLQNNNTRYWTIYWNLGFILCEITFVIFATCCMLSHKCTLNFGSLELGMFTHISMRSMLPRSPPTVIGYVVLLLELGTSLLCGYWWIGFGVAVCTWGEHRWASSATPNACATLYPADSWSNQVTGCYSLEPLQWIIWYLTDILVLLFD